MGIFHDRMQQDLQLAQYRPSTQTSYLSCARAFVAHHMKPPTDLGREDIRDFLLTLVDRPSKQKMHWAAIKFLYTKTLARPEEVVDIPWPKMRQRLPDIPSADEVAALLGAIDNVAVRVVAMAAYGAGLRIAEACSLKAKDIDAQRGLIHVRDGKRGRDRYVVLPERLLLCLREYWRATRPRGEYLFAGSKRPDRPLSPDLVRRSLKEAASRVGLTKHVTPHVLRQYVQSRNMCGRILGGPQHARMTAI